MNKQEIIEKIRKHKKDMTDKEWVEVYDEALKLDKEEFEYFKRTLEGRILAQWGGIVKRRCEDKCNRTGSYRN